VNSRLLSARQTKYVAYAALYVIVILAIVSVANVLANRYNKSYDSTANKRYSLSDQTAKIVKGLKQNAAITYYDRQAASSRPRISSRDIRRFRPGFASTISTLKRDPRKPERPA